MSGSVRGWMWRDLRETLTRERGVVNGIGVLLRTHRLDL